MQQPHVTLNPLRVARLDPLESGATCFVPGPSGLFLSSLTLSESILVPWADLVDFLSYAGGHRFSGSVVAPRPAEARLAAEMDAPGWEKLRRQYGEELER
jgi:hypothetical protein